MQVDKSNIKPGFTPFKIAITFESELEAKMFHSIFNCLQITDASENVIDHEKIRNALKEYNDGTVFDNFISNLRKEFSE